jgi:Raf kinase inhibitor-like YbhB/YbcL family protein
MWPALLALAMTSSSALTVTSAAFESGQPIPAKFSCSGADISPEVSWSAGPSGTKSYALIVDDPDAPGGTFVHWVLYNLRARDGSGRVTLSEGSSGGAAEGQNGFGKSGYGGPCPPPGKPHHYRFNVYALNRELDGLSSAATADQLRAAFKGSVLAEGTLTGTFKR